MKKVYLWYVAVEGAKMVVVLGWNGSEDLEGPGNTGGMWGEGDDITPPEQFNVVLLEI
jgi:hypothetical protein